MPWNWQEKERFNMCNPESFIPRTVDQFIGPARKLADVLTRKAGSIRTHLAHLPGFCFTAYPALGKRDC
jgi:hypothetical protein